MERKNASEEALFSKVLLFGNLSRKCLIRDIYNYGWYCAILFISTYKIYLSLLPINTEATSVRATPGRSTYQRDPKEFVFASILFGVSGGLEDEWLTSSVSVFTSSYMQATQSRDVRRISSVASYFPGTTAILQSCQDHFIFGGVFVCTLSLFSSFLCFALTKNRTRHLTFNPTPLSTLVPTTPHPTPAPNQFECK